MLQALGHPLGLLVLLVATVVAVTLVGWTSSLVAVRAGSHEVRAERRTAPDPRRHVDPFGAVASVLAGPAWARPVPVPYRTSKGRLVALTLAGPAVAVLVGCALLLLLGLRTGQLGGASALLLQRGAPGLPPLDEVLALAGIVHLSVGLLSLVPLPPLPGGQLLLGLAPRSPGWQKAELYLVEKNLGLVAVLVLLLLPLGGSQPLLLAVLSTVLEPLVRVLTGVLAT